MFSKPVKLGDNCIQNFHLGRYIVGYTIGNLVLRRGGRGALKRDFRTYIWRYTSQMKILKMVIPIIMFFCSLSIKRYKLKGRRSITNSSALE